MVNPAALAERRAGAKTVKRVKGAKSAKAPKPH